LIIAAAEGFRATVGENRLYPKGVFRINLHVDGINSNPKTNAIFSVISNENLNITILPMHGPNPFWLRRMGFEYGR
jgi:hypothetical protein